MKLAMAQMRMSADYTDNIKKSKGLIEQAKGCDLVFFPEVQLSPFFAQYRIAELPYGIDGYVTDIDGDEIALFQRLAKENSLFISPNLYVNDGGKRYDMSLMIDGNGVILGQSKMVNVDNNKNFYEADYYTPSEEGYRVYDTPFGKVGIVICYDRHFPESVRYCAAHKADLVIIPTANTFEEDMQYFEQEIQTLAKDNAVTIAMCNRVGTENKMRFAGQSLIVSSNGETLLKADGREQLIIFEI